MTVEHSPAKSKPEENPANNTRSKLKEKQSALHFEQNKNEMSNTKEEGSINPDSDLIQISNELSLEEQNRMLREQLQALQLEHKNNLCLMEKSMKEFSPLSQLPKNDAQDSDNIQNFTNSGGLENFAKEEKDIVKLTKIDDFPGKSSAILKQNGGQERGNPHNFSFARPPAFQVKLPHFGEENSAGPCEFLARIEKYFLINQLPDDYKIFAVEEALRGRARTWFESLDISEYSEFRCLFLNEFFSIQTQVQLKIQWTNKRFQSNEKSLVEYFERQYRDSKYLSLQMSEYEKVYTIVQQLPDDVRLSLITVDYNSYQKVHQALGMIDSINSQKKVSSSPSDHGHKFFPKKNNQFQNHRENHQQHGQISALNPVSYQIPDFSKPPPVMSQDFNLNNRQTHLN